MNPIETTKTYKISNREVDKQIEKSLREKWQMLRLLNGISLVIVCANSCLFPLIESARRAIRLWCLFTKSFIVHSSRWIEEEEKKLFFSLSLRAYCHSIIVFFFLFLIRTCWSGLSYTHHICECISIPDLGTART